MTFPVSVCILVKNEETNIKKCIESVSSWAREVLVGDTGSTDQTINIAKETGASIIEIPWENDFSKARNRIISVASSKFILMLDADEVFDINSKDEILRYINIGMPGAARVTIINHLDDESEVLGHATRLFPNEPQYSYSGIIHEQLKLNEEHCASINTDIVIHHYGYLSSEILRKDKSKRNLELLLKESENESEDPYVLYQLARTFYLSRKFDDSKQSFDKCFAIVGDKQHGFLSSAYYFHIRNLMSLEEWHSALNSLSDAMYRYPDYTDLYFLYGELLIQLQDPSLFANIEDAFISCLKLGECSSKYESYIGVGSFKAAYNLGIYYELLKNYEQALEMYRYSYTRGYTPALMRYESLLERSKHEKGIYSSKTSVYE
ncbi:glycosyltransferase family 2 protein [Paenibacillus sp. BR1-192]|nr:glycosyltransferase family 2 protein [Paenibacillus sp. BR1-192]WFB58163.1 glycosyltransferase family 2 protein [Paenibacillus sp. BR1-192]